MLMRASSTDTEQPRTSLPTDIELCDFVLAQNEVKPHRYRTTGEVTGQRGVKERQRALDGRDMDDHARGRKSY